MNSDEKWKATLRTWQPRVELPGSFRAEVWQRIADAESARNETGLARFREWLAVFLVQPRYAVALGAVVLSASIAFANVKAREFNSERRSEMETRYVTSIDPYAHMP